MRRRSFLRAVLTTPAAYLRPSDSSPAYARETAYTLDEIKEHSRAAVHGPKEQS